MAHRDDIAEPGLLRGRDSECALLDDVLAAVRAGESRTLVIHGEAGIGKTALLDHVAESATDMRLLRSAGVESEMELAFASLHLLCAPLLASLDRLPAPQRAALEVAFGLAAGPAPNQFLVGRALLTLLSDAAEERPTLCVVDDAQWLDEVSARTLAFLGRRLLAERVGLLFAARALTGELRGLPEMKVVGLRKHDARALLRSAVPVRLDERVAERIVAETRGNPLALLELPRGLTVTQLAGGFGLLDAPGQTLATRIEESFERRIEALPAPARLFMLVAAAEPLGDPLVVWNAAERLGLESTAGDSTDGLLAVGASVTFRHPLVRAAVYRSAAAADRRRVHLALAAASDREVDPDRRAWHLAAGTVRPDEEIALELERSAGRAQARGGLAAAAAFLERAAALSADAGRRTERALGAVEASLGAGAFTMALRLLGAVEAGTLDAFQRARVKLARGQLAYASGPESEAASLLLEAAQALEPFDLHLARETYLSAWRAGVVTGRYAREGVHIEIARAIRALPPRGDGPRPLDLLLDGLAMLTTDGYAAAVPTLRQAARAVEELPVEDVLRWLGGQAAATIVWDDDAERRIVARQAKIFRDAGALGHLPLHLNALGQQAAWSGDLEGAMLYIAEAASVSATTGSRFLATAAIRVAALRGNEPEASTLVAAALARAKAERQGTAEAHAHWAAAVLNNAHGRYEQAAEAARAATTDTFEPFVSMWALSELVEAEARLGHAEAARDALERLIEKTEPVRNDLAHGLESRCRALLAERGEAETAYREAIDRLSRTRLRAELARAELVYGEWLRREGRRVDGRARLRASLDAFAAMGIEGFAERASRELAATGETVRKRGPASRDALTPQEAQIARLARAGLSNAEIGERLFLSARTVEWHLRKVYGKLGIRARRELRQALPEAEGALVGV
jgi:DNA-binding CsgD family transcriptional regulator